MPQFIASAKDQYGEKVTKVVTCDSSQEAVAQLETSGYSDIVLHTDDAMALFTDLNQPGMEGVRPEDLVKYRTISSWGFFLNLLKQLFYSNRFFMIVSSIYVVHRLIQGQPNGTFFYIAVALLCLPFVLALYTAFFTSSHTYNRLLNSWAWGRWEEVRELEKRLTGKVPAIELDSRVGVALAKLGHFDEGLELISRNEDDPDVPRWMYLSRLAEFYEMNGKPDRAIELLGEAYETDPENPTVELDYAMMLLKSDRNPQESDRLIKSVEGKSLSDLLVHFIPMAKGLQAFNSRDYKNARTLFLDTRRALLPLGGHPLIQMMADGLSAYLAIASAHIGDRDAVLEFYPAAKARLEALGNDRLLSRLNDAVKQYL